MGFLTEMVADLVIVAVVAAFCDMLLPESGVKRSVRLVFGLYFMALMLNPLVTLWTDTDLSAMDFSSPVAIGERIGDPILRPTHGYDHNFVLQGEGMRHAATVFCPRSGVTMTLETNMEGVQLYTGNGLDGRPGKRGAPYDRHGGLCLETQHYPNAVNEPAFPSAVLRAGETYRHRSVFRFRL